jgi:hypothetical protein
MLIFVADLRMIYLCLTGPIDKMGRADMVNSLMFVKGLLEKPSRYLEFDRQHKGSVPVFRINNC